MGMNYREMVNHAKKSGVTNEQTMWESIDSFSELLEELKETHPQMYWDFMRKQHGIMYKGHYDEKYAIYDVSQIRYTNKVGEKKEGAYWSVDQIESATQAMKFPEGTTKWDKFVAGAIMYSDLCKKFDDAQIIDAMYAFFFNDEDWSGVYPKLWAYMSCKPHKHD